MPLFGYLGHRAAARRHAAADAARGDSLLLAHVPDAALGSRGARARPAARRAGTGDGEPRDDRRQRVADGVDGDHGRVVPPIARRLAGAILPADLYVRAGTAGDSAYFSADDQRKFAGFPACAASSSCACKACCSIRRSRASCCSRATFPPTIRRARCRWWRGGRARDGDPPPVWVSEAVADLYGFGPGADDRAAAGRARRPFIVAGVWRDYARQQGAIVIDRARYARADRRHDRQRRGARGSSRTRAPTTCARELEARSAARPADVRDAGRDPRDVAARLRPHVRRDLRAGGRGGRHRTRRPVVVVRRAGVRAAARVRHAAAPRHDAAAGRRDAGHRGLRGQRHRARSSAWCSAG